MKPSNVRLVTLDSLHEINWQIRSVHEGKKALKCKTCGNRFGRRHELKGHIKSVCKDQKAFKC